MNEWISVKERLPPLVNAKEGDLFSDEVLLFDGELFDMGYWYLKGQAVHFSSAAKSLGQITHWAYLVPPASESICVKPKEPDESI